MQLHSLPDSMRRKETVLKYSMQVLVSMPFWIIVFVCVCVCVFESLPVKEGGRERVHCTLSQ